MGRLARAVLLTLAVAGVSPGLLAQSGAADSKASRFYEDALVRYEKRDLAGAIVQLKSAVQQDRTMLPVHVLLGKALLANSEVPAAEAAFNEALRLGVNRAEVVLLLARTMEAQGKQQALVDGPRFELAGLPPGTQTRLLLLKAGAYSDLGDPTRALKAIDDARSIDPGMGDAWLAEVPIRIRARQFKEALVAVEKARVLDPASAQVEYQHASVLHVVGDRAGALAGYDKVLASEPKLIDARVARAGLYLDMARNADAANDVAALLADAPLDARGWYLQALLADREGKQQAVKTAMTRITGLLDPVPIEFIRYRPQILLLNGQAHYALGEREKAKPFFEAFQRVQPASPVSKLLANIQLAEGNHERAVESLEQYLRAFPNDSQAMALLASAHMARGRHARAAALMQEALRRKDEPELYTAYGLSLMGTGQSANAITQLETAYRKDPGQTQAGFALVGLYLRGNQIPKALALAQALAQRQPANPSFQNLLGQARASNRDVAGARAAYEQALKLDPTLSAASLNLSRLEMATNNLDRTQALLSAVLKADERNTEALYQQAALAERRNDAAGVLRALQKGMDVGGSNDLRPGLALVDLHLRKGRNEEALKTALQLSSQASESLPVLLALTRTQLANTDYAGMRTTLTTASRVAQFDPAVQVEIALLQLAARNLPGAAYSVEKALSGRPDFLPALALQAEIEIRQATPADLAKAEQHAAAIVRREPKLAVGYGLQGDLAMVRKQPAAGVELFRKAHATQPSFDTLKRLSTALSLLDQKAAIQLLDQWCKAKPGDTAARALLAESHVRSGDLGAARAQYEALRTQRPNDPDVLNNLANVLVRLKDPQAATVAEQALALAPNNVVMIDTAGWVAFHAGKLDRATQLLRDARLRDPENNEIRYHLATALAANGRKAEAREELEVVLRSKVSFDGRADAETLLSKVR